MNPVRDWCQPCNGWRWRHDETRACLDCGARPGEERPKVERPKPESSTDLWDSGEVTPA